MKFFKSLVSALFIVAVLNAIAIHHSSRSLEGFLNDFLTPLSYGLNSFLFVFFLCFYYFSFFKMSSHESFHLKLKTNSDKIKKELMEKRKKEDEKKKKEAEDLLRKRAEDSIARKAEEIARTKAEGKAIGF